MNNHLALLYQRVARDWLYQKTLHGKTVHARPCTIQHYNSSCSSVAELYHVDEGKDFVSNENKLLRYGSSLIKIFLSDFHVFMGKFSCCWVFLQHSRTMRLRKTLPVQCTIRSHTSEWLYTEWPVMESCEFQLTVDNICVNTDTLTHVSGIFFSSLSYFRKFQSCMTFFGCLVLACNTSGTHM